MDHDLGAHKGMRIRIVEAIASFTCSRREPELMGFRALGRLGAKEAPGQLTW